MIKGADAAFSYFGDKVGAAGKGLVQYTLVQWHVIVLNHGDVAVGSTMMTDPTSNKTPGFANDLATKHEQEARSRIMNLRRILPYGFVEEHEV